MIGHFEILYENWCIRLDELAQMRKPRLGQPGSALSHLGSQGTIKNNIPAGYRSPGPAQAVAGSNLNVWKPRGFAGPTPMSGRGSGGKLYSPRKPSSIKTKSGSIMKVLSNA